MTYDIWERGHNFNWILKNYVSVHGRLHKIFQILAPWCLPEWVWLKHSINHGTSFSLSSSFIFVFFTYFSKEAHKLCGLRVSCWQFLKQKPCYLSHVFMTRCGLEIRQNCQRGFQVKDHGMQTKTQDTRLQDRELCSVNCTGICVDSLVVPTLYGRYKFSIQCHFWPKIIIKKSSEEYR